MTPDEILDRLRELKIPHQQIADAIGRERSAATKLMGGKRRIATKEIEPLQALIHRYEAHVMMIAPPTRELWWLDGLPDAAMPIRGVVRAGAWLEIDPQDDPIPETYPAAPDPRFPRNAQWLSRVRGDSMNALTRRGQPAGILDGDLVHVVDAIAIDYRFKDGDVVEVERIRFDGSEREITLKQVAVSPDGEITLWPRSTNPKWADPIPYREGSEDDIEVRVRAKVIQHIRQY